MGDLAQTTAMPKVHPDLLRSGDTAAIQAAEALVKAITTPEWPKNRLKPNGKMTLKTIAALQSQSTAVEVRDFLVDLAKNGYVVDSLQWHYFKYKYEYGDSLSSPDELERRFNAVLSDEKAMIYQTKSGRLLVYSPQENRLAVVSVDGQRISVHRPDPGFLTTLGNHQWQINQMID